MLVLHGTWLPSTHHSLLEGHFIIWGEVSADLRLPARRRGRRLKVSPHPFAADTEALDRALHSLPAGDAPRSPAALLVALPTLGRRPLPSPELLMDTGEEAGAELSLTTWQVTGYLVPPEQALRWLAGLPERDRLPAHVALGADLQFWRLAARFQLSLLARQRFVPPCWRRMSL